MAPGAQSTRGESPLQPWLHDLVVAVDGNMAALSGRDGGIHPRGAEGLFVDDERVLSVLTVELGREPLSPVASSAGGGLAEFLASARHLGRLGPDSTVEVRRTRTLSSSSMSEVIEVSSRADAPVCGPLRIVVAGDGASIGAVKSGTPAGVAVPVTITVSGVSWRTPGHLVEVAISPPSSFAELPEGGAVAEIPVRVGPGQTTQVLVTVAVTRSRPSAFDADSASPLVTWAEGVRVTAGDPRLRSAVDLSLKDLQHLLLSDPEEPQDFFAGAGTPWYQTLFGRDALWTARFALPLGTELAGGTLRALARRQGRVVDVDRAEEPGKIPHELRRVAPDDVGRPALPTTYFGTVDATALWMCLLHDAWRWGLPETQVTALLPAARAAARWLLGPAAPDDDGLVKYLDESGRGLANQGWKDSGDSIRWRDGRIAKAPIALVEAQAYGVEAAIHTADLLQALSADPADANLAEDLRSFAGRMVHRVRERFWVGDNGTRWLALAIDGAGEPVDAIGSNMGHVLGTGCLSREEAGEVVRLLTDPRMLGPFGILTYASDNRGFNPMGYHTGSVWTHDSAICALGMAREGYADEAGNVAVRLLDLAEAFYYRFPELCSGTEVLGRPAPYPASCCPQAWSSASAVALLTVALGLEVDVPGRTVTVRPAPSLPFGPIRVQGLRIGGFTVDVAVDASGGVAVTGLPAQFVLVTREVSA